MGPAPLRGGWGRGRDPMPGRGKGETIGRAEDQKGACPGFPLPTWAPREPAEIPVLILCPPSPPLATRVLREWEGGKGEQK